MVFSLKILARVHANQLKLEKGTSILEHDIYRKVSKLELKSARESINNLSTEEREKLLGFHEDGSLLIEALRSEQTSDEVFSFRNDFCPYRSDHDLNPYVDHNTLCFCGAKYKSNIINAVTDRLPESTHESEEAAASAIYTCKV